MARSIDWDQIPDSTLLPQDLYEFEVEDLTEETSKKGKLMYRGVFRVVQPANFAGAPIYDYFAVGTDDDPTGQDDLTWKNSIGVRRLKRLFKAAQIPMTPEIDEMVETVKGQHFVGSVSQEVDDGLRDPKYAGVKRNRIDAMYPVGTRLPGSADAAPIAAPAAVAPPRPAATAAGRGAAAAKPAPTRASAAPTVPCPYCGEVMARAAYPAHAKSKHPDAE